MENGKEGKSKMIASCGFLENELCQFSGEEGVTLADSVETLCVDLRPRVKSFRSQREGKEEQIARWCSRSQRRIMHFKKHA